MFLIEDGIIKAYAREYDEVGVIIPEGVTAIDNEVFKGMTYLKSVTIPEGVTTIGDRAFYGCLLLNKVTLPETITHIGEDAFYGCSCLTSINTLGQITRISKRTFAKCVYLKSITIPHTVTHIDFAAFYSCTSLTEITLPENFTYIGERAFYNCRNLTTIYILGQSRPASDAIPPSEICIGMGAFSDCQSLTAVTLPDAVTNIGDGAFYGCRKLASINIPRDLTHIGKSAFLGCVEITSLKLPEGLEVIEEDAFNGCVNLKDIDIPSSVRKIGAFAFQDCDISSITIPKTIDSIPNGLFGGCDKLEKIEFPDNITSIGAFAFEYCNSLREVTIHKNIGKIGYSAFELCENLRKVTFSRDDIEIENNAFGECTDLVTNLSIKQWKNEYGVYKMDYAVSYMRQYTPGDPFFEDVKEENKKYIRGQLKRLLKKDPDKKDAYGYNRYQSSFPGFSNNDVNAVIFLTREKMLRIDEVDLLLERMSGNPEAVAILLDYKAQNFSEEFLEKYENDKLQKELGLKERTVADWKQIFRLGDDGFGGYIILGYKGSEVNVDIPEKIGKKPVTAIADFAFSPDAPYIFREIREIRYSLETVIIPDSVTCVGVKIFSFCKCLNCIVYQGKTFTPDEFEDYFHPQKPER